MANHDIFIRLGKTNLDEPDKSTLDLSDGGTSVIKSGDTVTWIIDDKAISSILVMDDNRHNNVFAPDPKPVKGSTSWMAKAKEVKKEEVETYTICWVQDGQVFCYDPKIVVNP
jgi:hypothetical protein